MLAIKRYGKSIFLREYISSNLLLFIKQKRLDFSNHFEDYLKFLLHHISENNNLNLFDMQLMIEMITDLNLPVKRIIAVLDHFVSLFYSSVNTA